MPGVDDLAQRRRERRRAAGRAIAWRRHDAALASSRITGKPARAFNRLEARFARLLDDLGVDYQWQFRLGRYVYDFLLPGRRLVEVHGTWTHGDPRVYAGAAQTPAHRRAAAHDVVKLHNAAGLGYRVLVVWERDLRAGLVTRASLLAER